MTYAQHKQVGQHRDAQGFFTPVLVPTDLGLAQAQARFEFPVHQLHGPTPLVDTHDLARRQFGQIGHQDLGLFRAQVPPFFTQYDSVVAHMTQTQAGAIRPKSLTAFLSMRSGNPRGP